jgi:hypothetical protein
LLGDLQLQLIFAKAQIATLEQLYAETMAKQKVTEVETEIRAETLDHRQAPKANGAATPVE